MALPVINNVAKIVVRGHVGANLQENVFHATIVSPLTQANAQTMGDLVGNFYNTILGDINASAGWDKMEFYDLATAGGPQFTILPATFPLVGTAVVGALPPTCAALVSWRGATGGRSGRGRSYVGGYDEGVSDGELMSSVAQTVLQTAADDLVADVPLVIVSYYLGTDKTQVNKRNVPIPRVAPVKTAVTVGIARQRWANQRRRNAQ